MNGFVTSVRNRLTGSAAVLGESTPAPSDQVVFDEELLARLRRLTLLSNRAIAQGLAGEHRSQRRGSSPEFADFKSYSQGDDFRRIDWNIYSRLGELFVRLSEVTTEITVHLLLDASASMDWTSDPARATKFTYARQVAGALGYVGLWHFDRVAITPFGAQLGHPFGPAQGRSNTTQMLRYLTDLDAQGQTSIAESIERYARARKRPGILLVISDLFSGEPEDLRAVLGLLRGRGWQTTIVQIVDPAERDPAAMFSPDPSGRPPDIELIDLETADRLRLNPDRAALDGYRQAWQAWQTEIETVCTAERTSLITLQTDWPFATVVLDLLFRQGIVR